MKKRRGRKRGATGRWRTAASVAAAAATAAVAPVASAYALDMRRAYGRIRGSSSVIPSPYGDVEYVSGGSGPTVLVIHGSGGGYDQGELIARALLGDGFGWIAPSRFGYLRSTLVEGVTFDDQAHAYARLLDHLGVREAAVVALSHGGPSALLFAALHPERVSSLALVSCGVASSRDPDQASADRKGTTLASLFKHDALYWAVTGLLRKQMTELMGADDAVVGALTPEQRRLVDQVIDGMNPVAPRAAGAAFDNEAALPDARIAAVRAPTLVVHAEDDRLQLYHNAEYAVRTIPDARLMSFARGGHLLMAVELAAVREAVQGHILAISSDGSGEAHAQETPPHR